jgi:ABC-type multidrug transport system ATPase subunit
MDDVARFAGRIMVMSDGKLIADGTPAEVFADVAMIESAGLDLPQAAAFAERLKKRGAALSGGILTFEGLVQKVTEEAGL